MPTSDPAVSARQRLNVLRRWRTDDDPAVLEAERDHAAESIAAHVARVVAQAPPLTPAQRDRIAALLRPTAGSDTA